jgi:hypothetical protein
MVPGSWAGEINGPARRGYVRPHSGHLLLKCFRARTLCSRRGARSAGWGHPAYRIKGLPCPVVNAGSGRRPWAGGGRTADGDVSTLTMRGPGARVGRPAGAAAKPVMGTVLPPQSKELAGAGMVLGKFHHGGGGASKAGWKPALRLAGGDRVGGCPYSVSSESHHGWVAQAKNRENVALAVSENPSVIGIFTRCESRTRDPVAPVGAGGQCTDAP